MSHWEIAEVNDWQVGAVNGMVDGGQQIRKRVM